MYQWDVKIFRYLNSWAGVNDFYDKAIIFKAEYLLYIIIAAVFLFFIFDKNRARAKWMLLHTASAGIVARFVFKPVIVFIWDRTRPFAALPDVHRLINETPAGAMPSGHATFSFAVAFALSYYYPKTSILFFLAALSMGLARVSAGVHWPSDILVGAVVGIFAAWLLEFLFKRLQNK